MISVTKQHALRAANRPSGSRITTVFGRRVRVRWWHDALMGTAVLLAFVAAGLLLMAVAG
jgi:hypothetical protein